VAIFAAWETSTCCDRVFVSPTLDLRPRGRLSNLKEGHVWPMPGHEERLLGVK